MVERMRAEPGAYGLVGANGGFQSKYAALVLSTDATDFPGWSDAPRPDDGALEVAGLVEGPGTIQTYTVVYGKDGPTYAIAIGTLPDGRRFIARADDADTVGAMVADDPLGKAVLLTNDGEERNAFTLA
jgi:acetyl-CoA C-acetyltransferase